MLKMWKCAYTVNERVKLSETCCHANTDCHQVDVEITYPELDDYILEVRVLIKEAQSEEDAKRKFSDGWFVIEEISTIEKVVRP